MTAERICSECAMWRPHVLYPFVGLCSLWGKLTTEDDGCERFRPLTIDDGSFYWVPEFRTRVTGEEAKTLVRRGVRVYVAAYVDPDVREEVYGAF
ncbi:MAG: hypothetical protein ACP5HK_03500 [Acidilobus sp.]